MEKILIEGGVPLRGHVKISGSKDSALAAIPASILTNSPTVLKNIPRIEEVAQYQKILQYLGASCIHQDNSLTIYSNEFKNRMLSMQEVSHLSSWLYLLAALLAKFGEVAIEYPTSTRIRSALDHHLKGFKALGASVIEQDAYLRLTADQLTGARIYLDDADRSATISLLYTAVMASGQTIIENAAKDPEVVDVVTLLTNMGANIKGAGTDVIRVWGKEKLKGSHHTLIPDRIEAGFYMIAVAATKGEVVIEQIIPEHLEAVTAKLIEMGVIIEVGDEWIRLQGIKQYSPIHVRTHPYPGFPTDLQHPITSLFTQTNGTSLITEHHQNGSFQHVKELRHLGADIKLEARTIVVDGPTLLQGERITVDHLSTCKALLIAALVSRDPMYMNRIDIFNSGYENWLEKLVGLGARMKYVSSP
ncbi:UDP-N-acetylglucosamine 1-carboxyvinyltransferase [Hazenella sp. IB182357]|uniref:UDP-N-acetylglucosamine 1-carboxyvinyltransferase n=1 Tax=Polycladospora coralii TaxID=2771432 RepID=A0A926RX20_9BACL|nr:UDP-N-acetylglucosamine 1-carboxyvinyltransferase [Polycladospora coralii]MBD1372106.1 UDP-N-acetylglucosamine 1-carboxyvinyltransferase [Polycladospora coralii]MBS7530612.1 UDP-N-acetylglucosamine 1-carboxyvinyltransferase [Polycladospora coralii]